MAFRLPLAVLACTLSTTAVAATIADAPVPAAQGCPRLGLCVVETESHYPLDAASLRALLAAVEEGGLDHGRGRAHALSDVALDLSYVPEAGPDGCRLEQVALRLEVELRLPEFVGAERSPVLQAQADALAIALRRHERGHVHIVMEHAHSLLAALLEQPPAPDCRSAQAAASRLQLRHGLRHSLAQQRYDARTGHGAGQGARLQRRPAPDRHWPASPFSRRNDAAD